MRVRQVIELPPDDVGLVRTPILGHAICAGFPSPADDFLEGTLDLPRWLAPNPPVTFALNVSGDSMRDEGVFDRDGPQRSISTTVSLPEATNDTLVLIAAARHGVARTWREQRDPAWRYSKAGVVTVDLLPLDDTPRALIGQLDRERSGPLMAAMDACNRRWGRGSVVPGTAGVATARKDWSTKFEMRLPRYTTQLGELPTAHAT